MSMRVCRGRRTALIGEHHLSGSPQIAALTIIREVWHFDGDPILLREQRGRRYRIVRSSRRYASKIDDATRLHRAIAQSEGSRAAYLEAIIDGLADNCRYQCGIAIEQPHQILTALNVLSRRCQQFPNCAGRGRKHRGLRVELKAASLDIDFLLQLQEHRFLFGKLTGQFDDLLLKFVGALRRSWTIVVTVAEKRARLRRLQFNHNSLDSLLDRPRILPCDFVVAPNLLHQGLALEASNVPFNCALEAAGGFFL